MTAATAVCVPLPSVLGFCLECSVDSPVPPNGRCIWCSCLLIWRSDRPRPPIVTEHYLVLLDAAREIPDRPVDVAPAAPLTDGARGRFVRRPLNADGTLRWSMTHDRCVRCRRDRYPHASNGLCRPCRSAVENQRRRERALGLVTASTSADMSEE